MTGERGLLLDSHVLFWWLKDSAELSTELKDRIDTELAVFVSAASAWELCTKAAVGKIVLPDGFTGLMAASDVSELPVSFQHGAEAGSLPFHHRDPFDRMLIAQARIERLALVTRDKLIKQYDVPIIDA